MMNQGWWRIISVLPEEDQLYFSSGALDDGRGVLVTPPIKNLVVNLAEGQTDINVTRPTCLTHTHLS